MGLLEKARRPWAMPATVLTLCKVSERVYRAFPVKSTDLAAFGKVVSMRRQWPMAGSHDETGFNWKGLAGMLAQSATFGCDSEGGTDQTAPKKRRGCFDWASRTLLTLDDKGGGRREQGSLRVCGCRPAGSRI